MYPERRRRQRHPRASRSRAGEGGLHHRRSGRLRGRHHRLFGADRQVQDGAVRDLQHLPDPARLRHVLAPGGAAGLHQDGQDRPDRQDRPVPVAVEALGSLGYNLASACYWHADLPLQVVADRDLLEGSSPTATRRRPASSGTSSSAPPCRCSTPALRRCKGAATPKNKAAVAKAMSDAEGRPRRSGTSTSPRGRCRTRQDADHRRPVGQGEAGQQVQARLRHLRERRPTERPDPGKLQPYNS